MTEALTQSLRAAFAAHGIEAGRLDLERRVPRPQYLQLISSVDVALDPFPFNGHTTTCDCLWQGVPVVSLSGETYVSRFGGSALHTLGLDELIARDVGQYQQIAVDLASDLPRLQSLRRALRDRMAGSPLLDFAGFTRHLEAEYRRMWHCWCQSHAS